MLTRCACGLFVWGSLPQTSSFVLLCTICNRTLLSKQVHTTLLHAITAFTASSRARDAIQCLAAIMQSHLVLSTVPGSEAPKRFPLDFTKENVSGMLKWSHFHDLVAGVSETYDTSAFLRCLLHSLVDYGCVSCRVVSVALVLLVLSSLVRCCPVSMFSQYGTAPERGNLPRCGGNLSRSLPCAWSHAALGVAIPCLHRCKRGGRSGCHRPRGQAACAAFPR